MLVSAFCLSHIPYGTIEDVKEAYQGRQGSGQRAPNKSSCQIREICLVWESVTSFSSIEGQRRRRERVKRRDSKVFKLINVTFQAAITHK